MSSRVILIMAIVVFGAANLMAQAKADVKTDNTKSESNTKDDTETVYTTFHVIPGKEAEFAKVLEKAWPTYHKLGMVLEKPHLILSGADEQGRPYFIEILTWKDHDAPDHAS